MRKTLTVAAIAMAIAAPVHAGSLPGAQRSAVSANRTAQAQKQRQGQTQTANGGAADASSSAYSDTSNPQSTSVDSGSGDTWAIAPAYSEGSLPAPPVLSPGFTDVPQSSYGLKVLGPVLTVTETGPAPCVMSNAWAVAALKRQMLVDALTLYGAGIDAYFVEYNQAVAIAAAECAR